MHQGYDQKHPSHKETSWWRSRQGAVALVFMALVIYYLITEHAAHTFQLLPWLIILLCPLMHIFMHHGGHGHAHDDKHSDDDEKRL